MILHFHYSPNPNSGEIRRIRNIDNEVCNILNTKSIEVEFYSLRDFKKVRGIWHFNLTRNVIRKFYIPLIPFTGSFWVLQWICDLWTSLVIFYVYKRHSPQLIIGEYSTSYSAMRLKCLMKSTYVADMHGALPEEYIYDNPDVINWKLKYITRMESLTSKKSDLIICQSEEMKRHITNKYGVSANRVYVYKCGVDADLFKLEPFKRASMRMQLGITNESFVFVYVGGLMKWQKIEDALLIFANAHNLLSDCKFLIITRETDNVRLFLQQLGLLYLSNDIIALSSTFDKVSDYLNAADVAFLLRDDVTMNRVASPTKLAEYMACGLPVISSKVAAYWVDRSMMDDGSVICYDERTNLRALIKNIMNCDRTKIRQYAIDKLSLRNDARNIREMCERVE